MVQNGKLAASMPARVRALNNVDLPTLGKPTIPQLNPIDSFPSIALEVMEPEDYARLRDLIMVGKAGLPHSV